jgi:hypothetical protein
MRYFLAIITCSSSSTGAVHGRRPQRTVVRVLHLRQHRAGRLRRQLGLGASLPWQYALEKLTGSRQMDAAAIGEYFQPLSEWLKSENQGQNCLW